MAKLITYNGLDVKVQAGDDMDGAPPGFKPSATGFPSPTSVIGKNWRRHKKKSAAAVLIIYGNYPRKSFNNATSYNLRGFKPAMSPLSFSVSEAVAESVLGEAGKGIIEK